MYKHECIYPFPTISRVLLIYDNLYTTLLVSMIIFDFSL